MSEQSMSAEMGSPKDRAVAYLTMRQGERLGKLTKGEKGVKTSVLLPIPKVERTSPLVESVTAYEKLIDAMGDKGYEGSQQVLENLRPIAYDAIRAVQWTARAADFAVSALLVFAPKMISDRLPTAGQRGGGTADFLTRRRLGRAVAVAGMIRFRPAEWVSAKLVQASLKTAEWAAPVTNAILRGGEPVQKTPDVTPTPQAT